MIPVLPPATKIDVEPAPLLGELDPVIVINSEQARYYLDACEAFSSAGKKGFPTKKQVEKEYADISLDDACNYNIYGFTLQGWLNFEEKLAQTAGYVDKLRRHIDYLERLMEERQQIMAEREKMLSENLESSTSMEYKNDD